MGGAPSGKIGADPDDAGASPAGDPPFGVREVDTSGIAAAAVRTFEELTASESSPILLIPEGRTVVFAVSGRMGDLAPNDGLNFGALASSAVSRSSPVSRLSAVYRITG